MVVKVGTQVILQWETSISGMCGVERNFNIKNMIDLGDAS